MSLAGVEWSALLASIQAGGLPNLAALLRSGISGSLAAPAPRLACSLTTSLITGKRAHQHGVLHAQRPREHDLGTAAIDRPSIRSATLGAILSESELTVHQIGWPISHPAEQLNGVVVSDRFATATDASVSTQAGGRPWITPSQAAQELFARRTAPAEIEPVALAQLLPAEFSNQPRLRILAQLCRAVMAESLTVFRATKWCLQNGNWDCTLCAFPALDRLQTQLTKTVPSDEHESIRPRILSGCYEHLDMLLGQLAAAAGEEATIAVVGMNSGHRPSPRIVIAGPSIETQAELPRDASVLDVAPTILALLGIPLADDMDGKAWTQLFAGDSTAENIETVTTWDTCVHSPADDEAPSTPPPIDEAVRHLVELGYVDPLETQARQQAAQCRRETERNHALSLLDAELTDEAIKILQTLKAEHPNWPTPRELLVEIYLQTDRHELAEQEVEFLVHHGAESARLYYALGRLAAQRREFDQALLHYHVSQQIDLELEGLQQAHAVALMRMRKFELASEMIKQSLNRNGPSARAHDALAVCALGQRDFEAAVEHALSAIDQDPHLAKAHYHLAVALIGIERFVEARHALEFALQVEAEYLAPLRLLAWLCQKHLSATDDAIAYREHGREIIRRRRQQRR